MASRNMPGQALDTLGEAIAAGRRAPGASIPPEPTPCDELGVGRTAVCEALESLVAKGMLVTGPRLIARDPAGAERVSLVRIDGAAEDIEQVLGSRRRLPAVAEPARQPKGHRPAVVRVPSDALRRRGPAKT